VAEAFWTPAGTALGAPSSTGELSRASCTALASNSAHSERPSDDGRCPALRTAGTCAGHAGVSLPCLSHELPGSIITEKRATGIHYERIVHSRVHIDPGIEALAALPTWPSPTWRRGISTRNGRPIHHLERGHWHSHGGLIWAPQTDPPDLAMPVPPDNFSKLTVPI